MILKTRSGANIELRAGEWGTEHIIPRAGSTWMSDAGLPISERDAYGLPAVSNVIRSVADLLSSLPFFVYNDGDFRTEARDTWQWRLLHDQPSAGISSFQFFYDLAVSIEATQNAFIRKVHFRAELAALEVLDPHRVKVEVDRQTGEKTFDVWVNSGRVVKGLTPRDILHIRGFTPNPGSAVGVSLIQMHANALSAQKSAQKFEGDYFRKGGIPPFWFIGMSNARQAVEVKDAYMSSRDRAASGEPGFLHGQLDVKSLPISMEDAKYIENKLASVDDVCRIFRWPKELLEVSGGQQVPEEWWDDRFLKIYVLPRLRRIERAFAADPDFFAGKPLFGEFLTNALERASFVTRVRGYKDARQGGWVTANEIRKWENLPPKDGGDELQETPVGGAPNAGAPNKEPDDDD
jgi:HK97 family phage portal protein